MQAMVWVSCRRWRGCHAGDGVGVMQAMAWVSCRRWRGCHAGDGVGVMQAMVWVSCRRGCGCHSGDGVGVMQAMLCVVYLLSFISNHCPRSSPSQQIMTVLGTPRETWP